jgi:hypothetical protein
MGLFGSRVGIPDLLGMVHRSGENFEVSKTSEKQPDVPKPDVEQPKIQQHIDDGLLDVGEVLGSPGEPVVLGLSAKQDDVEQNAILSDDQINLGTPFGAVFHPQTRERLEYLRYDEAKGVYISQMTPASGVPYRGVSGIGFESPSSAGGNIHKGWGSDVKAGRPPQEIALNPIGNGGPHPLSFLKGQFLEHWNYHPCTGLENPNKS